MKKVLLISGSSQDESLNERYLHYVWRYLNEQAEFELELINTHQLQLPFVASENDTRASFELWREKIASADAFIIATPEYNHALPAVLKNAFDALKKYCMQDKPVMLLGVSTGRMGTVQAQHSIYPILRQFGAWLMPDELFITLGDKSIDKRNDITDTQLRGVIDKALEHFIKAVEVFGSFT